MSLNKLTVINPFSTSLKSTKKPKIGALGAAGSSNHLLQDPLKTALAWRLPVSPMVQRPDLPRTLMSMQQLQFHHFANLPFAQLLGTAARPSRIFLHSFEPLA
jgi:hypothetical protein